MLLALPFVLDYGQVQGWIHQGVGVGTPNWGLSPSWNPSGSGRNGNSLDGAGIGNLVGARISQFWPELGQGFLILID